VGRSAPSIMWRQRPPLSGLVKEASDLQRCHFTVCSILNSFLIIN